MAGQPWCLPGTVYLALPRDSPPIIPHAPVGRFFPELFFETRFLLNFELFLDAPRIFPALSLSLSLALALSRRPSLSSCHMPLISHFQPAIV
jgi:hypothetical protein